jgi:hypothetical protein
LPPLRDLTIASIIARERFEAYLLDQICATPASPVGEAGASCD